MSRSIVRSGRRGFTLADLMITTLILGILATVTAPKLVDTLDEMSLEAAARHVAADLRYARQMAKTKGTAQRVTFTPATDSYELHGLRDLDRASQAFIVVLPELKYQAELDAATFGSGTELTFNMYGQPDQGGAIVISRQGMTKTVQINATTGEVTVL